MTASYRSLRALRVPALCATLFAAACGGGSSSPTTPTPTPNVPFSQTDLVVGTGTAASNGRVLTVNYTLWLYDESRPEQKGTQLETSVGGAPYTFPLGVGQVIRGWDQGLQGMRAGGKRRLVVPPDLAYGATGRGSVPPNATLIFEIDLLAVS